MSTPGGGLPQVPTKAPVGAPPSAVPGFLCALIVTGVGVCGIRDALVALGAIHGRAWSRQSVGYLHGLTPNGWMIPIGVVAALVGLWFLLLGLRPRRSSATPASSSNAVWIAPGDLARIGASAARQQPGVIRASASAKRSKLTVNVVGTAEQTQGLQAVVGSQVSNRLNPLPKSPTVKVRTRTGGGNR